MDMKLAVEKTVILAYGTNQNRWKVTEGEPDIEQALVAKYLGIEVNIQGRNLIKKFKMIGGARTYAHPIMGCTQSGLDRALTADMLWESVQFQDSYMLQRQWSYPNPQLRNWRKSNI